VRISITARVTTRCCKIVKYRVFVSDNKTSYTTLIYINWRTSNSYKTTPRPICDSATPRAVRCTVRLTRKSINGARSGTYTLQRYNNMCLISLNFFYRFFWKITVTFSANSAVIWHNLYLILALDTIIHMTLQIWRWYYTSSSCIYVSNVIIDPYVTRCSSKFINIHFIKLSQLCKAQPYQ